MTEWLYPLGVIHGRFQILHNDHLKFILEGKKLSKHLIVGITNPDPRLTKDHDSNPHRSTKMDNPLTYYERMVMIRETLLDHGIDYSEFSIVPFPINIPELLSYYVPFNCIFFLSIYDDWGKQKKAYLESLGLNVHVLWEVPLDEKGLSGKSIREAMINDLPWEQNLPKIVVKLVKDWRILQRLKSYKTL